VPHLTRAPSPTRRAPTGERPSSSSCYSKKGNPRREPGGLTQWLQTTLIHNIGAQAARFPTFSGFWAHVQTEVAKTPEAAPHIYVQVGEWARSYAEPLEAKVQQQIKAEGELSAKLILTERKLASEEKRASEVDAQQAEQRTILQQAREALQTSEETVRGPETGDRARADGPARADGDARGADQAGRRRAPEAAGGRGGAGAPEAREPTRGSRARARRTRPPSRP